METSDQRLTEVMLSIATPKNRRAELHDAGGSRSKDLPGSLQFYQISPMKS